MKYTSLDDIRRIWRWRWLGRWQIPYVRYLFCWHQRERLQEKRRRTAHWWFETEAHSRQPSKSWSFGYRCTKERETNCNWTPFLPVDRHLSSRSGTAGVEKRLGVFSLRRENWSVGDSISKDEYRSSLCLAVSFEKVMETRRWRWNSLWL